MDFFLTSKLAGFALGEADLLRRAMGKKKKAVMEAQRKKFLDGASERNIDASKAKRKKSEATIFLRVRMG